MLVRPKIVLAYVGLATVLLEDLIVWRIGTKQRYSYISNPNIIISLISIPKFTNAAKSFFYKNLQSIN